MRYDWYQVSVPATPSHCIASIIERFGDDFEDTKPTHPYKQAIKHAEAGFRVQWGGVNPLPHVIATGTAAPLAASFLRDVYPDHAISRVDVCHDLDEEGGFDRLRALIEPGIRAAGVQVTFYGDPDEARKPLEERRGRTVYYGSKNSDVRLVLYEKGLKEREEGPGAASWHWVRLELRVRPRKGRKASTARLSASQMWGLAKWTRKVSQLLDLGAPDYRPDTSMRDSTARRALRAVLSQYQGTFRRAAEDMGRAAVIEAVEAVLDVR